MMRQFELVDSVAAYTPNVDENLLNRAYVYAVNKHGNQKRASGDPYFSHPIEVAGILTSLKLDPETVITGLLHDTLEDTDATPEELTELFGSEVAHLVNGVTKLSQIEMSPQSNRQAENFRKFLVATASDIRILIVKLADRLHNMRTLHFIKLQEKRNRIARETMDIYAPLAGRMGIQSFREEMEDLAFKQLNAKGRDLIIKRLEVLQSENSDMLASIASDIEKRLAENDIPAHVVGRQKRPFSIWRKMEHKSISLEQLSDIFGFRIIVNSEVECYRALGAIHTKWPLVPGRFKDYISVPKSNNYRALHTTIVGPNRQRVEVQICTHEMHDVAENGVAAHWLYKEKTNGTMPNSEDIKPFRWLQDLVTRLAAGSTAEEFMEDTRLELFHDRVFCFTPKGRLISLSEGATVLDFAYAVHTMIGNTCIGARINGNEMPMRTKLQSGDEVEIITSPTQKPRPNWEYIAVTGKARAAIRHSLRDYRHKQNVRMGKDILYNIFKAEKCTINDTILERALDAFNCETLQDLYAQVGQGDLTGNQVLSKTYPDRRNRNRIFKAVKTLTAKVTPGQDKNNSIPVIGADENIALRFAENCFPLPGDQIVGIAKPGEGIIIYPAKAEALAAFENMPESWVPLKWDIGENNKQIYDSRLNLTVVNKIGTLGVVANTIGQFNANISNLQLTRRDDDFCNLQVDVQVRDIKHVNEIISALRGSRLVNQVKRFIA